MNKLAEILKEKINGRNVKVGIIGLGYVGLPLALAFADNHIRTVGFDIDENKIDLLNKGQSYISHISASYIESNIDGGYLYTTADLSLIAKVDVIIICVPTPIDEYRIPDLSYIESTANEIGQYLQKGSLIVLESTTYPGTTRDILLPILEYNSGMRAGNDFFLAYSPEREDPNNKNYSLESTPKIVGGLDDDSLLLATKMYEIVTSKVVQVNGCEVAESAKLLENIFRAVNIALVNEMKTILEKMGINIWEVIDAASTKPFGFMRFEPGPGLGGHCLPIDPFYLVYLAKKYDLPCKFVELAGEINTNMPYNVVIRSSRALNEEAKTVKNAKILVIGIAYKPNVDDIRESPGLVLIQLFEEWGATVDYYDPHVSAIPTTRKHGDLAGKQSITLENLDKYDLIVISTNHEAIDFPLLLNLDTIIIDTRNAITGKGKARVVRA